MEKFMAIDDAMKFIDLYLKTLLGNLTSRNSNWCSGNLSPNK